MVDAIPQLVAATPELEQVLSQVEHASHLFSDPNPATRSQGEAVFLHVRQSTGAVDFACFALSRTGDAFVLFQAFQAILDNLPTLSLDQPTSCIDSLSTLRDFLLEVILARSAIEKTKGIRTAKSSSSSSSQSWTDKQQYSWPKHTQSRAFQTFAAVEKRLIGLQVEAENRSGGAIEEAVHHHTSYILDRLVSLLAPTRSTYDNEEHILLAQSRITVGFGVITALLDETGTTYSRLDSNGNHLGRARSVDFSGLLPLQHRWCKALIQTYVLPGLLDSIVGMLCSTLDGQSQSDEPHFLFSHLVSICARIFGWSYIIEDPFAGLSGSVDVERQTLLLTQDDDPLDNGAEDDKEETSTDPSSRASKPRYRSIPETHLKVVSADVISALYRAYEYAETLEKHKPGESTFYVSELRKALLDVASCRPAVSQEANRGIVLHSKRFQLDCMKSMISQALDDKRPDGVYGNSLLFISQLLHCFLTSSEDKQLLLAAVDASVLVESFTSLTTLVMRFAFESRPDSDEEDDLVQLGDEAVDEVLSSWRILLPYSYEHATDEASQSMRMMVFRQVVHLYIELRLVNAGTPLDDDPTTHSDLGEENVTDAEKYQDQLITLASLARDADVASCLQYLSEGSTSLLNELQHFYKDTGPISPEEEKRIEGFWEQAHWIMLIAGHIIADQSKGEVAMIAQEIAATSTEGQSGVAAVIDTLGFALLDLFSQPSSRMQSPRVAETALWFNARCIPVYLLVNTTPLLSARFSGQAGMERLRTLLVRVQNAVQIWGSDSDVVLQIAAVIKSFSLSEGVMRILLGLSEFQSTVIAITGGLDHLPAKTHGPLISSIVGCIYTSSASQSPEAFFGYITQAIDSRFNGIIQQPNFASSQVFQRPDVILGLLNSLDMLDGLASSVQPKSAAAVYSFLSRYFDTLVNLVQLYHERSEVVVAIIRVYRTLVGALDLGFGAHPDMVTGLNSAVSALLSKIDERSLLGDSPEMALEEDMPFEGLCLIIEMLSDLMLASENDAADPRLWFAALSNQQTSDVCLQGFSRVIPLLTEDARSVARVRRRFAKLTSNLWISFPHRISGLAFTASNEVNSGLFQSCITAIVISLGFVESALLIDCFAAIRQLSMAVEKVLNMTGAIISTPVINGITASMTRILTTVMNGVLIEPLATSLLDVHLLATRALLRSLINDKMGGISALQVRMQEYCATTSLVSQYSSQSAPIQHEEDMRKRHELSNVVAQIATLCLNGQQQASQHSAQGREEEATFLKEARKVAWEGRAKIRAV